MECWKKMGNKAEAYGQYGKVFSYIKTSFEKNYPCLLYTSRKRKAGSGRWSSPCPDCRGDGYWPVSYTHLRRNITIDVSKGMDGAIASLTGNEKLQPSKAQSTTEKHIVSDLLIDVYKRQSLPSTIRAAHASRKV